MPGRKREEGFGLILLIGITAALAILAAALVMLLTNQQWNTARERSSKTSESYAEAALNSAVVGVENDNSWLTTPFTNATEMSADYSTISGAPTVTYQVYDNLTPVNYGVNWDSNGDGEVWVQTTTTYQGRTTTVRELVQSKKSLSVIPFSAAWTDTNMTLTGTSNIYYVNGDGTPDTSGSPYATTIECGGTSPPTAARHSRRRQMAPRHSRWPAGEWFGHHHRPHVHQNEWRRGYAQRLL